MSLSTSNSKDGHTIASAFAAAVIMLLAYHLLVIASVIKPSIGDTQQKQNMIKIENYAFLPNAPAMVAIGTSILDNVLSAEPEDAPLFNFCLPGLSVVDGVDAIETTGRYPGTLLIELSSALIVGSSGLVSQDLSPQRRALMSLSPIFRTAYQPSCTMVSPFRKITRRIVRAFGSLAGERGTRPRMLMVEEMRKARRVSEPERVYNAARTSLERLKKLVDKLEECHSLVCFVYVPQDRVVESEELCTRVRDILEQYFPRSKYHWIVSRKQDHEWQTSDGIHLIRADAQLFDADMKEQLTEIINSSRTRNRNPS